MLIKIIDENVLLIVFICFSIIIFFFYFQFAKQQKKLINMYAKHFGSETYEATIQKLINKPLTSPLYAMNKSFLLVALPFKKTKYPEINQQAAKTRKAIYIILLIFLSLIVITISYALLYACSIHTINCIY